MENKIKYLTLITILLVMSSFSLGYCLSSETSRHLRKYEKIESVMKEISKRQYDFDNYDCKDFSRDAKEMLESKGIKSSIVVGRNPNEKYDHAFIGIWIEPQTGKFVNDYNFIKVME